MSNKLQVFSNPEFGDLRTINIDGRIWLVANDVANALGFKNPWQALSTHVDEDDLQKMEVTDSTGRIQSMNIINESGFYSLVLGSKLSTAKKFKRWVTNEVIPSVVKNGFFIDPNREIDPDMVIALAQRVKELKAQVQAANETALILSNQISELTPKATYYDLILNCKDLVSVSEIAKDYGLTAKRLNQILHELDVQYQLPGQKTWLLKSKFADKGYTGSKTHTYLGSDGANHTNMHTYWTQSGRLFIYDLLKSQCELLPIIERESKEI
mgnify:CR=1 FL=1